MSNEVRPRFNLIDEPWITVRYLDGATCDVSLRTAFRDAAKISDIGGELPTQSFAILRLMLAILYRATVSDSDKGWEFNDWQKDWENGLPLDVLDDYFSEVADRFWLLHPERPFFQVADLSTAKGDVKDTAALIFDLPSNNRLFTTRSGAESLHLPFAEAARWLVNAQAFDPSGIKSGANGDKRVKGGKGYPIGLAWSGLLGGLMVIGSSLDRTLLLNFVLPGETADLRFDPSADIPIWEQDTADTAAVREHLPRGPIGRFTWQSRRIRLVADGDLVVGCVLANGDALTPQNGFTAEPMSAWRYSEPQTKKFGEPIYMPREHQPKRAFWRGISALLPQRADSSKARVPATITALAKRRNDGVVTEDLHIRVRAVGVIYGSNNAVVDDIIDDELTMSTALLREQNAELATEADNAVHVADAGVLTLKRLAQNLARAAGGDGEAPWVRADEAAYAALDGHYRHWLAGLDGETDPTTAITTWKDTANRVIGSLGSDLVRDAGPAAWAGREVRTRTGTEFITTPRAEAWFLDALRKTFGAPAPQPSEEVPS